MFVKPTVLEPHHACIDKGNTVIGGEDMAISEFIQKPPTKRSPPIWHHCGVSGHIRPRCPQCQAQKEPSRQVTSGTRPPTRYQAPPHPRRQQQFVPTNHSDKLKKNKSMHYKEEREKPESDQSYEGLLILMRNLLRWMDNQLKSYQQPPQVRQVWARKDVGTHPLKGSGPT
jgi:hypothetical protein